MTYEEQFDDVLARCHQTGNSVLLALVKNWINRVQEEVQTKADWHWLQDEYQGATTDAVKYITIDAACDQVLPYTVRIDDSALKLAMISDIDQHDPGWDSSGEPSHYAPWEDKIYLWPVPDGVYTVDYRGTKKMTALSADDAESVIPAKWHEILVLGALWRAEQHLDDNKFPDTRNEYDEMIGSMKKENSKFAAGVPVTVGCGLWFEM